jgi:hypothetical protein
LGYNLDQQEFVGDEAGYAPPSITATKEKTLEEEQISQLPVASAQRMGRDEKRERLTGLVLVVNTRRVVYSHFSGFVSGISRNTIEVVSMPLLEKAVD